MGVHRERLAASKAYKRFVQGAKTALQKDRPWRPMSDLRNTY
jgi:hypothetical protein